jgi:leucyl-tRNA synthetase
MNLGGKEHQTVHFPVFIMNHIALMPKKYWPGGIFVNWWIVGKGVKISKSKGGAEPIPQLIKKYSADGMRLYYAHVGNPHIDIIWDPGTPIKYKMFLEKIINTVDNLLKVNGDQKTNVERWLISKLNRIIHKATESMEKYDLRAVSDMLYFEMYNNLRWYLRRGGNNKDVIKEFLTAWVRAMAPITPHIAEELWEMLGNEPFVSTEKWPKPNKELIDPKAELGEELISKTLADIEEIKKIAKIKKLEEIELFVAPEWKYDVHKIAVKCRNEPKKIIGTVMAVPEIKIRGKEAAEFAQVLAKKASALEPVLGKEEEKKVLLDGKAFLEKEFGCGVKITPAEGSREPKAKLAEPGKPGILIK